MVISTMTAFSTLCWRSARAGIALLLTCLALLIPWGAAAQAQGRAEVAQFRLDRTADGLLLYANVRFELPQVVEDALLRGVAMHFVAEAEVTRHRWYWSDLKVASAHRHMRLAYQPLTRRWRLNIGSDVITTNSLGMSLSQTFDTLQDALSAMQRISGWRIAESAQMEGEGTHKVQFRFALDLAQLPRPFQIGALGQAEWSISAVANQQIGPEGSR
jgi:Domain of unknown function (DUF4390)